MRFEERLRRLRPLHIAFLIPWMVVVVAARLPLRDNSFLWHVEVGRLQLEAGTVLTQDPLSFTFAEAPWRTQSWLIELLYAWSDARIGLEHAAWIIGVFGVLFAVAIGTLIWLQTRSVLAATVALALSSWVMAPFLNPRPVIASYLLLALAYIAAERPRLRWVLVPMAWVWASVHASYILGIALVGVVRFRQRRYREAFVDAAAMLAVSFLTAHGWGAVDFLVGFVANRDALSLLTEWSTPNFLSLPFLPILGLLLALIVAGMRDRLHSSQFWVLAFGLVVLFSASRSVLLGWLILIPLAAQALSDADDARWIGRGSSGLGAVGWALAIVVIALPLVLPIAPGFEESRFPIGVLADVDTAQHTYHDDVTGGFLAYALGDEFRLFVDDRAELYGAEFFEDLVETRSGTPTWHDVFDRYSITQAIVRIDDGLLRELRTAGWFEVAEDEGFVLLVAER